MDLIFNNFMILSESISIFAIIIILLTVSFVIANNIIPVIINVVNHKKIMDVPNERSSHNKKTPTLGGISFFASIMIGLFFIKNYDISHFGFNLIAATSLLFFMGLKDDLMVLSSKTKIFLQTIAIFLTLMNADIHILSLHGFLGINEIPLPISLLMGYLIVLYIINAYNLIDGIDGLAGMLGVLISSIFAIFFYYSGLYYYMLISIIIIGFLMAFLQFNLSKNKKIFMGDTGSMVVGFLLGVLTLRFLSLNTYKLGSINILPENIFIISLSVLFFPVIDVIRIIIVRFLNKQKLFIADRRHLHHILIDKGLNHKKASITIVISSLFVFMIIYIANYFFSYRGLLFIFIFLTINTFYFLLLLGIDSFSKSQRKRIKSFIPKQIYLFEFRVRKFAIILLKGLFFKELL
jgi:UDP-N-acetylmuramyl pentapeptide phosphotransferase/UDP-N-acetylglucosamine-1-phosphate transferase